MPNFDMTDMPQNAPTFVAGDACVGLELVDIYLWLSKKAYEQKELPPQLTQLLYFQIGEGETDEVSMNGLAKRWQYFFDRVLPPIEDISEEQQKMGREIFSTEEAQRIRYPK